MTNKISTPVTILILAVLTASFCGTAIAGDEAATGPTLYERLGEMDGIGNIVRDTIALHHANPDVSHYFEGVDDEKLAKHVVAFFAAGTGGPTNYEGRDMTSTHATMNMSDADFDSVVVDVLKAVDSNGIDAEAKAEVAAILESLRPAVMGTTAP
jgi:hemoglobin